MQQTIMQAVNPAVHCQLFTTPPGPLHDRRLADIADLRTDIKLAQPVMACLAGLQCGEFIGIFARRVTHAIKPVINQTVARRLHRRADAAGGRKAAQVSYLAKLKSWPDRHKVYPEDARNRRVEGTVQLYFVIGPDGRVLEYSIRESLGDAALDRAAEELIERAQPLPELPDAFGRDQLPIVLPIQFNLR